MSEGKRSHKEPRGEADTTRQSRGWMHVLFGELQRGRRRVPGVRVAKHPVRPHLDAGEQLLQVLGQGRDLDVILLILLLHLLWLNCKHKMGELRQRAAAGSQAQAVSPSRIRTGKGQHILTPQP